MKLKNWPPNHQVNGTTGQAYSIYVFNAPQNKCAPPIWEETREGTRIATDRRVYNWLLTCSSIGHNWLLTVSVVSINSSKDMKGCTSSLSALIAVVYIEAMRFGGARFFYQIINTFKVISANWTAMLNCAVLYA